MSLSRIEEKMFLAGWTKGGDFTPWVDELKRSYWHSFSNPKRLFAFAAEFDKPEGCGWRHFEGWKAILEQSENLKRLGCAAVLIDSLSKTDQPQLIDDFIDAIRSNLKGDWPAQR